MTFICKLVTSILYSDHCNIILPTILHTHPLTRHRQQNPAPVEKDPEKKPTVTPKRKNSDGKEKDPNAPKRNMSSYIFYSNANRSKFKEANPEASFGDLAKIISKAFKELSAEEKKPYEDMATADKERYKKEKIDAYDGPKEPPAKKAKKGVAKATAEQSGVDATQGGEASAPSAAATVTPKKADASAGEKKKKKRPAPVVTEASKNLFAAFLNQKKKQKTGAANAKQSAQ